MNEAETRAEHVDPALAAAGWGVVEGSRVRREYPITLGRLEGQGRRGKAIKADYVLEYRNTKLGVAIALALGAACWLFVDATRSIVEARGREDELAGGKKQI